MALAALSDEPDHITDPRIKVCFLAVQLAPHRTQAFPSLKGTISFSVLEPISSFPSMLHPYAFLLGS